jgi:hypothetical protein
MGKDISIGGIGVMSKICKNTNYISFIDYILVRVSNYILSIT